MSLDLDAVRRSIDGLAISIGTSIATSQEQTTRSVDQLTAGLEQMTREIAKLQAVEQYVLYKNSDPPPQQAPPQVPTPVPRPSQAPIVRWRPHIWIDGSEDASVRPGARADRNNCKNQ
jgi:hypothetical protein